MMLMWGIDRSGMGTGSHAELTKEGAFADGEWSDAAASVPITSKDPSWGNRDAAVTLVIYSDFECPYCSKVETTIEALKEKYGPEKLRTVWKHYPLPFHKNATPAHAASQIVFELGGSAAFWKFHDLAFKNAKALTPANFEAWAAQSGVDVAKFKEAMAQNKGKAKVDADLAAGKEVGVRGTPAFFVNGKFISGARPQAAFEQEIDAALAQAQQLISAGTPKDQVYVQATNKNFDKTKAKGEEEGAQPEADDKTVWKVPVPKGAAVKGSDNALVTIVEFSEFQCPFCAKVLPTMDQLLKDYGDKVRIVFVDNPLPFHQRATPASTLAHEAMAQKGSKGFWAAHDMLFENQKALEDADLWGYAEKLGLDVDKVKEAVASNKYKAKIDDFQALAGDLNAGGTPHFFINGRRLAGAQPVAAFKKIIDEEIPKAEALLKKGIAADKLYEEIIKEGKEPPPPEMKDVGAPPGDAPKKGGKSPKVVIHEFSDFECPFCSRVEPTIKQIMDEYGDTVQVVWRHKPLPFHKNAELAHIASQEAYAQQGDAAFWKMHGMLFEGQKAPGLGREALDGYAQKLGLDMEKFKAALDGQTHKAFVQQENELSNKIGVRGTPGFVIAPGNNPGKGYFLSGAQPYAKFKKLVDRAIKDHGSK
jgi:protein-disulfide isomerase